MTRKYLRAPPLDAASIAFEAPGHDTVISAIGRALEMNIGSAHSLIEGLESGGVKRLIVVGEIGSFWKSHRAYACWTRESISKTPPHRSRATRQLRILQYNTVLDWTFMNPAAISTLDQRTGKCQPQG